MLFNLSAIQNHEDFFFHLESEDLFSDLNLFFALTKFEFTDMS